MKPFRIVARLDIKGPNLIKGIQMDGYRVLGDPENFANLYYQEGIDELHYQDAVASLYDRNSLLHLVKRSASEIFIPLTVGGGIRSIDDVREVLRAGADKILINSGAVRRPNLINEISLEFGSQCVVVGIDVYRRLDGFCEVWLDSGRERTHVEASEWAREAVERGAGEIFLTSIDRDGLGDGLDLELLRRVAESVSVPVVGSGGAGKLSHFLSAAETGVSGVSAASAFHYHYMDKAMQRERTEDYKQLRMGSHLDFGNSDWYRFGYGGERSITVDPVSIPEVRESLRGKGFSVRDIV